MKKSKTINQPLTHKKNGGVKWGVIEEKNILILKNEKKKIVKRCLSEFYCVDSLEIGVK